MSAGVQFFGAIFAEALLPVFDDGRVPKNSRLLKLAKVMRVSAGVWVIIMLVVSAFIGLATDTCDRNTPYGFRNCSIFSTSVANPGPPAFVFSTGVGCSHTIVLFTVGMIFEFRALR